MSMFQVGNLVTATEFTDCFGKYHPAISPLTITDVRLVVCDTFSYFRIKAVGDGSNWVEGSEQYFTLV